MNTEAYYKAHRSLALFDASERFGRVAAGGNDAIDLLHRMSTNDLLPLIDKPGSGAQTVLTTEKGRMIDLITVLSHGKGALLTTSGGKEDVVIQWLEKFVIMEDAQFIKKSDDISQFTLFGPRAMEVLASIGFAEQTALINLENFHFLELSLEGKKILIQKTNRIIESGMNLLVGKAESSGIWALLQAEIEK